MSLTFDILCLLAIKLKLCELFAVIGKIRGRVIISGTLASYVTVFFTIQCDRAGTFISHANKETIYK